MSSRPDPTNDLRLIFALVVIGALAMGFIGLMATILPGAAGLLAVIFAMVAFVSLHYVVWGRWLGPLLSKERDEASEDSPPGAV